MLLETTLEKVGRVLSERYGITLGKTFREEHGAAAFDIPNLLEDLRTDAAMRSRYPGSVRNLSIRFSMTLQDIKDATPYCQALIAMYALGSGYAMPPSVESEMQILAESVKSRLDRARSAPNTHALDRESDIAKPSHAARVASDARRSRMGGRRR